MESLTPDSAAPHYAAVAILDAPATSPGVYDYSVPEQLGTLGLGTVVVVPLRGRTERGVVVDLPPQPAVSDGLKAIRSVGAGIQSVSPEFLDLARWMAERYVCSLGRCLSAFLPPMRSGRDGEVEAHRGRARVTFALAVPPEAGREALTAIPARARTRRRALGALLAQPAGGVSAEGNPGLAAALKWLVEHGLAQRLEEQVRPDGGRHPAQAGQDIPAGSSGIS